MNYYAARQVKAGEPDAGKWRYTCMNDRVVWPVGYCRESCPGHATAEEACEHYRQYLIDLIEFSAPRTEKWPKEKCEAIDGDRKPSCDAEATITGMIPGEHRRYSFCPTHATKEEMAKHIEVGEMWTS